MAQAQAQAQSMNWGRKLAGTDSANNVAATKAVQGGQAAQQWGWGGSSAAAGARSGSWGNGWGEGTVSWSDCSLLCLVAAAAAAAVRLSCKDFEIVSKACTVARDTLVLDQHLK